MGLIKETIIELVCAKQKMLPSPYEMKKHLFHLIDYELISYNGQTQTYAIEEGGLDLLDQIKREKIGMAEDVEDVVITIK